MAVEVLALLIYTGVNPYERSTWFMEVTPIFIAAPFLIWSWKKYPLTSMLYVFIAVHCIILTVGGSYTYARVPLGFWIRDAFHMDRNPYDRIGHFAQGFVPALIAREIFLRRRVVRSKRWSAFLAITCAMTISAVYELIEWRAAVSLGQGADAFLGTQGDPWDTQEDMATALVGALVAMIGFARWQDRQMATLPPPAP